MSELEPDEHDCSVIGVLEVDVKLGDLLHRLFGGGSLLSLIFDEEVEFWRACNSSSQ